MSGTSIVDYYADYFLPTVREVLDQPFANHGFAYNGDHRGVSSYWSRGNCFFRVGYLPETLPTYELLMAAGASTESPVQPKSSENSIGIRQLLPGDVDRGLAEWKFDGPDRLRAELSRAWEMVVLPYVVPLLDEPERLIKLIGEHANQLRDETERLAYEATLSRARSHFEESRFAEAIHEYEKIPPEQLSSADLKRIEIARRRT